MIIKTLECQIVALVALFAYTLCMLVFYITIFYP